jgi:uncharacterized membrane protein
MSRLLQPITSRPYLMTAIAAGVVIYFGLAPLIHHPMTRALIGWDGGVVTFVALALFFMAGADAGCMKRRAIAHDEGAHLMLILAVLAAVASVGGLVIELTATKGQPGADLRVALASSSVVLSWLFVQVAFAMHYAHVYFLAEDVSSAHQGGLDFGYGDEEPDYWDFLHFAIVIGATSQTADIVFKSKQMRRVGTLHSIVAFGFNTAILATMINLAASLF